MMFLCSLSLFIIMIESCVSQSISPLEEKVDAVEGETAALSCRYDGSADYLYWYRQYPGSRPEFLLRIDPSTKAVRRADPPVPGLDVKLNGNKLDLVISSSKISDSVLYYCALEPTVTRSPSTLYKNSLTDKALRCVWGFLSESCVSQSISPLEEKVDAVEGVFGADVIRPSENQETDISRKEGEPLTLKCSYDSSSSGVFLYWYRQYPNRAPQYLLLRGARGRSDSDSSDGRFSTITSRTSTDLTVRELRISDTALYYCALRVVGAQ
ncbi:hypothetical protein NFI96_029963 [Prochilodus magdalenae]|nr:hypothetical protein NFI96_029963 [Prochilodus magdalenae]